MSDVPKPPIGYSTWCEYLIKHCDVSNDWVNIGTFKDYARAELSALRDRVNDLKKIIRDHCRHDDNCGVQGWLHCLHRDGPRWYKWFSDEVRHEPPQCTCYLKEIGV